MSRHTTLKIGGPARYFLAAQTASQLIRAVSWARERQVPFLVVGGGSNLLVSDAGFAGLVIKNEVGGIRKCGNSLWAGGGTALGKLVNFANQAGLGGLEKLAGIPGTVAGAIYGNAGAYGQTIGDHLRVVKVFDGRQVKFLNPEECRFSYRESIFKKYKDLTILAGEWRFPPSSSADLQKNSARIVFRREKKYPPNLLCPGSFFKNIPIGELTPAERAKIPPEKIIYGKIPAGYLLAAVGAPGKSRGGVRVASYHGNLFFNSGVATAQDFWELAKECQRLVKDKFGIRLEPEVQLIGCLNP